MASEYYVVLVEKEEDIGHNEITRYYTESDSIVDVLCSMETKKLTPKREGDKKCQ